MRSQVEEKLACAKRLLHKVRELREDEAHLLAMDKLHSVQTHVEDRINVLEKILESLSGEPPAVAKDISIFGKFMQSRGRTELA